MRNSAMSPPCGPRCIADSYRTRWGFRRIWSSSCADRGSGRRHVRPARDGRGPVRDYSTARPPSPSVRSRVGLPAAAWRRCRGATCNSRAGTLTLPPHVTPAHDWREGALIPAVWLLCEEEAGRAGGSSTTSCISRPARRCRRWSRSPISAGRSSPSTASSRASSGSIVSRFAAIRGGTTKSS